MTEYSPQLRQSQLSILSCLVSIYIYIQGLERFEKSLRDYCSIFVEISIAIPITSLGIPKNFSYMRRLQYVLVY